MRLMQTVAARVAPERTGPGPRERPRPRRGGAAGDRPPAPSPLPRRAVSPATRGDRGAHPPDAGAMTGEAAPRTRRLRVGRGARRGARDRSSRRWSTTAWAAWRGARSPTSAGSSRRSGSTSRRSRSASTRPSTGRRSRRCARDASADPDLEVAAGVTLGEVLATFRAIARLQARFGVDACRRYVISFTTSPDDVAAVLELARIAAQPEPFGRPVPALADLPAGAAGPRRRAPARERGRPRGRDGAARRPARRRRLPRPPPGAAATPRR